MWEDLQQEKRRFSAAKTINIPEPNAKTKKTDKSLKRFLA
jgi:hypothetical protein